MKLTRMAGTALLAGIVMGWAGETGSLRGDTPAQEATRTLANRELTVAESVGAAREGYRKSLQAAVAFYEAMGDSFKLKRAKEELAALERIPRTEYVTVAEAVVDPKTLKDIPGANLLLDDAQHYYELSKSADRKKNAGLALERCLDLIGKFPESDRIDDAAWLAGQIYEGQLKDYHKAMVYYEKSYRWNPETKTDARIRAARMAYRSREYAKAKALYEEARKNSPEAADRSAAEVRLTILKARGY